MVHVYFKGYLIFGGKINPIKNVILRTTLRDEQYSLINLKHFINIIDVG